MSYCNFFNKEGGNLAEPLGSEFKTTIDPDFDSSSVRTKIEDGFHSLVSSETGDPIVGLDSSGNFQTQTQRDAYNKKVREQLDNDPATRTQNKGESFQDREDRLSFNDPTGEAKKRLLQMSEENDRISRSEVDFERPPKVFKPVEPPRNSNLPDISDLVNESQKTIRAEPANPNTIPAEYKSEQFKSNPEVISDSGKQLGDAVRDETLSQTNLKPTTGTQLDTDEATSKTPKFKQNSNDAKAGMLTEDDLDERSMGEVVGKVGGRVLGLAGLGIGIGETLGGKGTVKQKAESIAEQGGSQVGQEAGDEAIKRLELTKRYRRLKGKQKDFANEEKEKIEDKEGRLMNEDEAGNILDQAEKQPIQDGNRIPEQEPNTDIVEAEQQTKPTMNSESQADSELGKGSEPQFTEESDAFSQGGANAESSGMGDSVAKKPTTKQPPKDEDEDEDADADDAVKKAGTDAIEEGGEIDAIGGGPEDPIGDVIAGVVGLGTLLGGIFGDKQKPTQPKPVPIPNVDQSVQIGVDE